jgi:hypothetical protein
MLIVRGPDGIEVATHELGHFPCAAEARRFAVAYGMAEIDHRQTPVPEWPARYPKNRDASTPLSKAPA